jgi:hypothetical protein
MLDRSWTDITLDFVTKLFDSRKYNAILMMINRLSKMHHYILCIIDENDTTVEETTKLLIQHVWKLHELFTTMISNRDSQFIFFVWDTICRMLRIKAKLLLVEIVWVDVGFRFENPHRIGLDFSDEERFGVSFTVGFWWVFIKLTLKKILMLSIVLLKRRGI